MRSAERDMLLFLLAISAGSPLDTGALSALSVLVASVYAAFRADGAARF